MINLVNLKQMNRGSKTNHYVRERPIGNSPIHHSVEGVDDENHQNPVDIKQAVVDRADRVVSVSVERQRNLGGGRLILVLTKRPNLRTQRQTGSCAGFARHLAQDTSHHLFAKLFPQLFQETWKIIN